ncbi:MAG: hypothetical protein WDW36_007508 [Sanguina aurantia]
MAPNCSAVLQAAATSTPACATLHVLKADQPQLRCPPILPFVHAEVAALARFPSLAHLHLQALHSGNSAMAALAMDIDAPPPPPPPPPPSAPPPRRPPSLPALPRVTHLALTNVSLDVSEAAARPPRSCRGCSRRAPRGGGHAHTPLTSLTLSANPSSLEDPLPLRALLGLRNLARLQRVDLGGQEVAPGLLHTLAHLPALASLTMCRLVEEDRVTPGVGAAVSLPSLTHLSFTREVSDTALQSILPQPLLSTISLPKLNSASYEDEGEDDESDPLFEALQLQGPSLVGLEFLAHLGSELFSALCLKSLSSLGLTQLSLRGDFACSSRSQGNLPWFGVGWAGVIESLVRQGSLRQLTLRPSCRPGAVQRMAEAAVAAHRPPGAPSLTLVVVAGEE